MATGAAVIASTCRPHPDSEVMMPRIPDRRFPPPEIPDWWPYAAEFPRWHVWSGTDQLYHGRLALTDLTVSGEDPVDLRDEIKRAIGKLRETR